MGFIESANAEEEEFERQDSLNAVPVNEGRKKRVSRASLERDFDSVADEFSDGEMDARRRVAADEEEEGFLVAKKAFESAVFFDADAAETDNSYISGKSRRSIACSTPIDAEKAGNFAALRDPLVSPVKGFLSSEDDTPQKRRSCAPYSLEVIGEYEEYKKANPGTKKTIDEWFESREN